MLILPSSAPDNPKFNKIKSLYCPNILMTPTPSQKFHTFLFLFSDDLTKPTCPNRILCSKKWNLQKVISLLSFAIRWLPEYIYYIIYIWLDLWSAIYSLVTYTELGNAQLQLVNLKNWTSYNTTRNTNSKM